MAARQLWVFLTPSDVTSLLEKIAAREAGLVVSEGRYLRGAAHALLADPSRLERREALPNERRIYLFHPKHSQDLLAHEQPAGPFAGWSQIDEERSDCLVLRVPLAREGICEPSRLYAHTSYWRSGDKLRKRPPFSVWANQTLRWLINELPASSVRFMRLGPEAQARALEGTLALTYLLRTISPSPPAPRSASSGPDSLRPASSDQPLPAGVLTEDSPEYDS
jgi:hypothetical protein